MSEREIDLPPDKYRSIPHGPLGKPRQLWFCVVSLLAVSCVSALAAWLIGGPLAAFMPIPTAILAGIGIAGLYPGYWFNR